MGALLGVALVAALHPAPVAAASFGAAQATGRRITVIWPGEPTDLRPDTGFGPGLSLGSVPQMALYDGLAYLDERGNLQMRLAESIRTTPGSSGTSWVVRLRSNVRFSDGTLLDAAAVKFNWERMADPKAGSPNAAIARQIASMKVVDARSLSVKLVAPNQEFAALVGQSSLAFIGSPSALKARGAAFGTRPVGAGPYVLKEWVRGDHITLERNPRAYQDAPFQEVVVKSITDESQRANTISTGAADLSFTQDVKVAARAIRRGLGVKKVVLNGGMSMYFNHARGPFRDLRARRALALAFDGDAMNRALNGGDGLPVRTLFEQGSPLYTPTAMPGGNRGRAQALFNELSNDAGKTFSFRILAASTTVPIAQWFQAVLADYDNVKVSVDIVASTVPVMITGNFDVNLIAQPSFVDPYPTLKNWLGTGQSNNFGKYSSGRLDAALAEAQRARDDAARRTAYDAAAKVIAEDLPVAFMQRSQNALVFNKRKIQSVTQVGNGVPDLLRLRPS